MIAAVGRRLRPRASRRQATRIARARSSTASSRQRRSRLQTVVKGGNAAGSRRQVQPSRARCHKAWSMISVDQTRSRPTFGCGSSASIVRTGRTIIPCRDTSWIAGAYLRRSSAVHAIRVVPAQFGRQIGAGRRGANQKSMQISMLAFEQALIDGCLAWQRDGLNPPASVNEASEDYLSAEDVLGQWL